MSITLNVLVSPQLVLNSTQTYYTSTNIRTRIDKVTVTNTTGSADTITLYLVVQDGTAGASNTITSAKSIAAGETWNCPDLIGQILQSGGTIQAKAGTSSTALTFSVAGAQIT